ncbi:MAG: hypothetical protein L0154_18405 [Chloroflexi bacterium]|nr:hypothetical protein [Chloroflexota bacterium]
MDRFIVLPLLIPLTTAILAMIAPGRVPRRWVVRTALTLNLAAALWIFATILRDNTVLVTNAGAWPAPYGITLAVDELSALMLTITAVLALGVGIFGDITIDITRERFGFLPILNFMLMGINLAFITGDIFNLYVAFEVMLTGSFGLLVLGDRDNQIKGGIKYMIINLMSSTIFLLAIGLTYGVLGTLNMAHLAERAADVESPGILTILAAMYLVGFSIKAAAVPFFFWLPASYHTPPAAVTAIFGGILTKVGIYGMLRVHVFIFPNEMQHLQWLWLLMAGATMLVGVTGALYQREIRRVFSFLIISHVGYIMMGIGFDSRVGLAAAIFYMAHHMIVKTALFMMAGILEGIHKAKDLHRMGGTVNRAPVLSVLFFIAAMALSGIPPLSGFFAKFALLSAAFSAEQYILGGISLIVSLLTIIAVYRVWHEGFWKPAVDHILDPFIEEIVLERLDNVQRRLIVAPSVVLVGLAIGMGLFANASYELADRIAGQLLDRTRYVDAVLGDYQEEFEAENTLPPTFQVGRE